MHEALVLYLWQMHFYKLKSSLYSLVPIFSQKSFSPRFIFLKVLFNIQVAH
jgi:hypothetical protein